MRTRFRQARAPLITRAPDWAERLAAEVLAQAVSDATDLSLPSARRRGAAAFLLGGGEMLRFWCSVANIDPDTIARYVRRLVAQLERPGTPLISRQATVTSREPMVDGSRSVA
jgi:hypothetical protein